MNRPPGIRRAKLVCSFDFDSLSFLLPPEYSPFLRKILHSPHLLFNAFEVNNELFYGQTISNMRWGGGRDGQEICPGKIWNDDLSGL